tara:strand:- start:107 stop:352 length:246 start_codon:yes stop_codon:yes gene_type:complete
MFKVGDLVAKKIPHLEEPVKIGIVTESNNISFYINWTYIDKEYFMTNNHSIFAELNNYYLLGTQLHYHEKEYPFLSLLNSS